MMGRRRGNDRELNLYIGKRNSNHFINRLQNVESIFHSFYKYEKELNELHESYSLRDSGGNEYINLHYINYLDRLCNITENGGKCSIIKMPDPVIQQNIIEEMLSNTFSSQNFSKYCYSINGCIDYNSFSVLRSLDLKKYYTQMINKLVDDENAFVYQQAEWLGISRDVIERALNQADMTYFTRCKDALDNSIKQLIEDNGEEITKAIYIKWKIEMRNELFYFLQSYEKIGKNEKDELGKNERTFIPEKFMFCM